MSLAALIPSATFGWFGCSALRNVKPISTCPPMRRSMLFDRYPSAFWTAALTSGLFGVRAEAGEPQRTAANATTAEPAPKPGRPMLRNIMASNDKRDGYKEEPPRYA